MNKKKWTEKNGIIYFSVTSDGTSGEEWIGRLEKKGFKISDYAKSVLRSKDFIATSGIKTEIAILKGDDNLVTRQIRAKASDLGLTTPNSEVACLIRETFSDKEIEAMGLGWLVVMHESIKDFGGDQRLLILRRHGADSSLGAYYDNPDNRRRHDRGFAFMSPQVVP